jgi:glycosyltransferase involved in cell wall biosynthesis
MDKREKMPQNHRVAIITGQLVVGGAERQLYLWLSHLDREKFHPVVLTLHPGYGDYWEDRIEKLDIPLIRIQHRLNPVLRLIDIINALRPYQPKLVQSWNQFPSPYAGAAARLLGAKSIGGVRGSYGTFFRNPLEAALTLTLVHGILANSASTAEKFHALQRFRRMPVYTAQNAVEDQEYDRSILREQLSRQFGIPMQSLWIGSLGRMDPEKRFDLMLRALAGLHEEAADFHFLLIGDGPERRRLERLVYELGMRRYVTFTGEVPGAGAWLGALDIFCFTSLDEGLPNAVMEAAVAGIPIVGWKLPFMQELLQGGEAARLVETGDLPGFENALMELTRSPVLRHDLGQAARQYVLEHFSLENFLRRMNHAYEDILGEHPEPKGGAA